MTKVKEKVEVSKLISTRLMMPAEIHREIRKEQHRMTGKRLEAITFEQAHIACLRDYFNLNSAK